MTPKTLLLAFLISTASAQSALADGVIEVGAWTLWEEQSTSGTLCYMQTVDRQLFRKEDFLIEIHHAKNNYDSPIEVVAKINKNKSNNTALRIDLKAGSQLGFADLTGTKERFWAVPKNLSSLIGQLRSGENVNGKAFGSKEINVEIRSDGFSEVYAKMEQYCNNGYALLEDRFEKDFLAAMPNVVDGSKLTTVQVTALRKAYFEAFALHRQNLGAEFQLDGILSKYKDFINEQKTNREEKSQIQTIHLPQSQKALTDAQRAQIDLKVEIARLNQQIPALREQVQKSTQNLEQARATLAPLLPEFNRLSLLLRSNEEGLRSAQSRLSFIDSRTNELIRSITPLENEADQVDRHLRQLRMDSDRAIVNLRDTEFRRSQYDVRREIDRRLNDNGEYRRIQSERESIEPQVSQIQALISQIEGERGRIVSDLEACQAEAGKDCSEIEQGLAQADQLLNEKRNELNNLESRRTELDVALRNAESTAQNDVRREYDNLVDRENRARQDVNRIDDGIRSDQSRLSSIRNSELPRMNDEQRALSSERPSVLSQISDRQRQLSQAQQDLERFRSVNDYDRKANDVARKNSQLSQDQATLDQVLLAKAQNEQRLQEAITTETRMKQRIAELNARGVVLDIRQVELEKLLKNLPAERAPVDLRIASLKKSMNLKKEDMLKILKG